MMKIYICPHCGRTTTASRKKEVYCYKCNEFLMERAKISFAAFMRMSIPERSAYVERWMLVHQTGK